MNTTEHDTTRLDHLTARLTRLVQDTYALYCLCMSTATEADGWDLPNVAARYRAEAGAHRLACRHVARIVATA
jgi:hypothetical protein